MPKARQVTRVKMDWRPSTEPPVELEVVHKTGNIRSQVKAAVDKLLTGYVTEHGATITITIDPAEVDEDANPER